MKVIPNSLPCVLWMVSAYANSKGASPSSPKSRSLNPYLKPSWDENSTSIFHGALRLPIATFELPYDQPDFAVGQVWLLQFGIDVVTPPVRNVDDLVTVKNSLRP